MFIQTQLASYFLCFVGLFFVYIAKSNENAYWINNISTAGYIYYIFILGLTWYLSLTLAFSTLISCFKINYILSRMDILDMRPRDPDNCFGLKKCSELLIIHVSLAIYYLFGVILIYVTDFLTYKNTGVDNTFHQVPLLIIPMFIIVIIIFAIAITPLYECRKVIINEKYRLIRECSSKIQNELETGKNQLMLDVFFRERDYYQKIDESLLKSSFSKIIAVLSFMIPIAGIIVQIYLSNN